MKDYLNIVNNNYPVRKSEQQKENFRKYVIDEVSQYGVNAKIETLQKKHNNILIGDVDNAKVVFTAHYDTPATSIIPNLMMPRNPFLTYAYSFGYAFILVAIAMFLGFAIGNYFELEYYMTVYIYLFIYFFLFLITTRVFTNKHNINDNTSGVATILSLVEKNASNHNIAFILFDNEEKGLLGSKAFAKEHKSSFENKLVLNLDCVGFGEHILLVVKDDAKKDANYNKLEQCFSYNEKYNVYFYPKSGSVGNSDYKNFKAGIGIMTCKKNKFLGFYASRIHTRFDTIADVENIKYISDSLTTFVNTLN